MSVFSAHSKLQYQVISQNWYRPVFLISKMQNWHRQIFLISKRLNGWKPIFLQERKHSVLRISKVIDVQLDYGRLMRTKFFVNFHHQSLRLSRNCRIKNRFHPLKLNYWWALLLIWLQYMPRTKRSIKCWIKESWTRLQNIMFVDCLIVMCQRDGSGWCHGTTTSRNDAVTTVDYWLFKNESLEKYLIGLYGMSHGYDPYPWIIYIKAS